MLEQYSGKELAAELAPHWRGCAFEIMENKKDDRSVLLYAVDWDSEDAAQRYFVAYRTQLTKKWKQMQVASGERRCRRQVLGTTDVSSCGAMVLK